MSAESHADRRRTDRRQGDRRSSRPMVDESWFGALGEGDTEFHEDDVSDVARPPERERRSAEAAERDPQRDAQRQQTREARRVATSSDTALRRVFSTYLAARAVLGLLLAS